MICGLAIQSNGQKLHVKLSVPTIRPRTFYIDVLFLLNHNNRGDFDCHKYLGDFQVMLVYRDQESCPDLIQKLIIL